MNDKRQRLIDAITTGDSKKIRAVKPMTRYIIIDLSDSDEVREYTRDELEELSTRGLFTDKPDNEPYVIKIN